MDIDLALLQEAGKPPPDLAERIEADPVIEVGPAPWESIIVGGRAKFRTAVVKLSDRNRNRLDRSEADQCGESRGLDDWFGWDARRCPRDADLRQSLW